MICTLKTSNLTNFEHIPFNGEELVKIYKKANGIIQARFPQIKSDYRKIFAVPHLNHNDTKINWSTGVFSSMPKPLSELTGDERKRYETVLADSIDAYNKALKDPQYADIEEMIRPMLSCTDESCIHCGDGKIVISEWGLRARNGAKPMDLLSVTQKPTFNPLPPVQEPEEAPVKSEKPEQKVVSEPVKPQKPKETQPTDQISDQPKEPDKPEEPIKPASEEKKKKSRLKWLWIALAAIALIVGLLLLLRQCDKEETVETLPKESPEIDSDDIKLRDDSLRYEVTDRINLVVYSGGTLNEFIKDFRKEYPDKKKYQFFNPDTVFNSVILTVPKDEREELIEEIPQKMKPKYDVGAMPESVTQHTAKTNDPAMKNIDYSYYFDVCDVYEGWDVSMGSEDVVVAVIDCGFDLKHEEFKGKIVMPYNSVTRNKKVFTPNADGGDHGTHVAATAVGIADNMAGSAGIAPKCKLMPIQAARLDPEMGLIFVDSDKLEAIRYAIVNGADVINMSFGPCLPFPIPIPIQEYALEHEFKEDERFWNHVYKTAAEHGVTIVQAAGNDTKITGAFDPSARSVHSMKVVAVDSEKARTNFSNFGGTSTISAPGYRIYSAIPGDRYDYMDGTSMASPMVAGAAALLKSLHPDLKPYQIQQILVKTATRASTADTPPVLNVACALKADPENPQPCESGGVNPDCDQIKEYYDSLIEELERIKKEYPDCLVEEELIIPVNPEPEDFRGRWKSTTPIYNLTDNTEVVLYFDFNGTNKGQLTLVEEDGTICLATFTLTIKNDTVYISQDAPATSADNSVVYNPYNFTLRPDQNRRADGYAENQTMSLNQFDFKLIKISN